MRLLLDTNALLWRMEGTARASTAASEAFGHASETFVSVVAFAEIGIKAAVGKLRVPLDLRERLAGLDIKLLALTPEHGLGVARLPPHHRDPFDRLLVAQAREEGMAIVTSDRRLAAYDVETFLVTRQRGE